MRCCQRTFKTIGYCVFLSSVVALTPSALQGADESKPTSTRLTTQIPWESVGASVSEVSPTRTKGVHVPWDPNSFGETKRNASSSPSGGVPSTEDNSSRRSQSLLPTVVPTLTSSSGIAWPTDQPAVLMSMAVLPRSESASDIAEDFDATGVSFSDSFLASSRGSPVRVPSPTSEVIAILPVTRLVSSDSGNLTGGSTFELADYTGRLKSAEALFGNLKIDNDFRNQALEPLETLRTTHGEYSEGAFWNPDVFTWATPAFYHRPLYFEQINFERYGIGPRRCVQPFYSGLHFFASIAVFPYKLWTQHPHEKVYSLGHQRPGDYPYYQRRALLGQSSPGEIHHYWDDTSGYSEFTPTYQSSSLPSGEYHALRSAEPLTGEYSPYE